MNAPMLCPKKANGTFSMGRRALASVSTRDESWVKGDSIQRFSRPGSWIGQSAIAGGSASDHPRNMEAPPPAWGKQNRRKRDCKDRPMEVPLAHFEYATQRDALDTLFCRAMSSPVRQQSWHAINQ